MKETRFSKVNKIVNALEELNFGLRGHVVKKHIDPDFPDAEVEVTNMNVPAIADCQFVAKKFGVTFYVNDFFNNGIFVC